MSATALFVLALFVAANAQAGYQIFTFYGAGDENCTGTILQRRGTLVTNYTDTTQCNPSACIAATKRALDMFDGFASIECNATVQYLPGLLGFNEWDNNTCDGIINAYTQFSDFCFADDGAGSDANNTFTYTCLGDGTLEKRNFEFDSGCNTTAGTVNETIGNAACNNNRTSINCDATPAPTDTPTTAGPTDSAAPTTSDVTTIYTIKQLCKVEVAKTAFEILLSAGVVDNTQVPALCTISKCKDILGYTGASFDFDCKAISPASFDDTTAALVCQANIETTREALDLDSGSTITCTNTKNGGRTGTIEIVGDLPATGSFSVASFFFVIFALVLAMF